jgi:hypothetical protein
LKIKFFGRVLAGGELQQGITNNDAAGFDFADHALVNQPGVIIPETKKTFLGSETGQDFVVGVNTVIHDYSHKSTTFSVDLAADQIVAIWRMKNFVEADQILGQMKFKMLSQREITGFPGDQIMRRQKFGVMFM